VTKRIGSALPIGQQAQKPAEEATPPPRVLPKSSGRAPDVEVFALGKRGESALGDDILLISHDAQLGRTSCVVADGSTYGDDSLPARDLAALVASACMEACSTLGELRLDGAMVAEFLVNRLPTLLGERLILPSEGPSDGGDLVRSCAFVAAIATEKSVFAVGSGDCYVLARQKGEEVSRQRPEPDDAGGGATGGTSKLSIFSTPSGWELRLPPLYTFEMTDPETVYLCSDGGYNTWLSAYRSNPRGVDELSWPEMVRRFVEGQQLGTFSNDDVAVARLRFAR